MRVVLDSNVVISAYLWGGIPARIFHLATKQVIEVYASPDQIREIYGVLLRKNFDKALSKVELTPDNVVFNFTQLRPEQSRGTTARLADAMAKRAGRPVI